jgi:hypothetical protein
MNTKATGGIVGGPRPMMLYPDERIVPLVVECPTCHAPVPVSDTLCYWCGALIPNEVAEGLR